MSRTTIKRWLALQKAALAAQTYSDWHLIILDNASRPEERPLLGDLVPNATLIQSADNLGFAAGNNLAARRTQAPYLAFLNPDAFPDPNWLATLVTTAEQHPNAAAIGSTQMRADAPGTFDGVGDMMHASGVAYRAGFGRKFASAPPLYETFSACAAAMLVRRSVFEELGGFDERYFCYFEDVDLGFRMRLMGHSVLQSPDAIVAHVGGGGARRQSPFAEFHGARNRLWTFIKCMPTPLLWPMLGPHLAMSFAFFAIAPFRGRGFSALRRFLAGVTGIGPILQTRRVLQRQRRARTLDIARFLVWSPDVFLTRRPVTRTLRR